MKWEEFDSGVYAPDAIREEFMAHFYRGGTVPQPNAQWDGIQWEPTCKCGAPVLNDGDGCGQCGEKDYPARESSLQELARITQDAGLYKSSELPAPATPENDIHRTLVRLEEALYACASQPVDIDSMTLTRTWREILLDYRQTVMVRVLTAGDSDDGPTPPVDATNA